jgi:16S rRNA (guanine527-N7)-methyltransferase
MRPARIAELLEPFLSPASSSCHFEAGRGPSEEPAVLSPFQLQYISTYIDILLRWNARINLTAIRDPEEIVTRHFGESFFAARHLFPKRLLVASSAATVEEFESVGASAQGPPSAIRDRVADLGSGAGFPGVPVKLWDPNIALTLIESSQKKAIFLRELTRALTLTDVNIQNVRAEALPSTSFEVVTLRAVERFGEVLRAAAALLTPSGRLALLISSSQLEPARSLPGFYWDSPLPVPMSRSRVLLIGKKESWK